MPHPKQQKQMLWKQIFSFILSFPYSVAMRTIFQAQIESISTFLPRNKERSKI